MDKTPTCLQESYPFVPRLGGKNLVENSNETFGVLASHLHGGKPGVVLQLLDAYSPAKVRPIAVRLGHAQTDPFSVLALVVIPQRVDRLGPIKPLELFPQGESAGQVEALQRRRHAAQVGGIHFLSYAHTRASENSHHNPVRQYDGAHLGDGAAG